MVNINELRIGNLIRFKNNDKILKVESIEKKDTFNSGYCIKCDNGDKISINHIEAIPLTEGLLLKCGFEKREIVNVDTEHQYIYHHKEFGFISCNFAYCINDTNDYSEYDNVLELSLSLKHLHQLQNIYYDLTGKELDVKL